MRIRDALLKAKQFIKEQGGYTVDQIELHYQQAYRDAKTPVEYAAVLEEHRRVKAGYVAPWMTEDKKDSNP